MKHIMNALSYALYVVVGTAALGLFAVAAVISLVGAAIWCLFLTLYSLGRGVAHFIRLTFNKSFHVRN